MIPTTYECGLKGCKVIIKGGLHNYAKHVQECHTTTISMKPITMADLKEIAKQMSNK